MDMRKKLLGVEHPDTLRSMGNLAATYSNLGKWNEAEQLEVKVLEIRKKLFGAEHPDTLRSMKALAIMQKSLKKNQNKNKMRQSQWFKFHL